MAGATKLSRLEFAVGVRDAASTKLGKIMSSVDKATRHVPKQFKKAGLSIMGAWGAARGMGGMFNPAREMERSLNGLRALKVDAPALAQLEKDSKRLAVRFGLNAGEVIASAHDVRGAFNSLNGADLSRVTMAANIFAKAAKTDAAAAAKYLGGVQSLFAKQSAHMGDAKWVEALTGKTALAMQQYEKTSVAGFEGAFGSLGEVARKNRISLEEQMAMLGLAQQIGFDGARAGEVYKSLFAGRHQAEAQLGVKLTGADGALLPIEELLAQLQKSGAGGKTLERVFGADALRLLEAAQGDVAGLTANIKALQGVRGNNPAAEMALTMTDSFDRAAAAARVAGGAFSQKMLPGVNKALDAVSGFMGTLTRWTDLAPNLTRWIGYIVMAALGFAGVMGTLSAAIAVGKIGLSGFMLITNAGTGIIKAITAAQWLWNAAMNANPLSLIIVGIITAIGLAWSLIKNWDKLTAVLGDTWWGRVILAVLDSILAPFRLLFSGIIALGKFIGLIDEGFSLDLSASTPEPVPVPGALAATQTANTVQGGIKGELSNTRTSNQKIDQSTTVGEVHNHFETRLSNDEMREAMLMGA